MTEPTSTLPEGPELARIVFAFTVLEEVEHDVREGREPDLYLLNSARLSLRSTLQAYAELVTHLLLLCEESRERARAAPEELRLVEVETERRS